MKRTIIKTAMFLGIILAAYSCGNQPKDNGDYVQTEKTENTDEHQTKNGLALDDGKLWIANPETTTGVENMINMMNSFSERDNVVAYGQLTEKLESEFAMIFQKCTMIGEAHNQLHNFLIPIKDLFETLPSADLNQCQDSFDKLNSHLKEYKKFFE
jgi:hypothetical protein